MQRYGKYIEQIENDLIQCKDPFPKTIADASRVLAGWKNKYNSTDNKSTDANNGVEFTMASEE